ncbi:SseB family protein [Pseudooceanicola sp.]|uniref:SseB family protein n=1 Tax=Pseudooceanicola sp. TaxID=1914328 RepID=UPI00261B65B9|nr:SseB family protein [Pseudooceanicola sp.]MDF1855686.1 SseB family protein [Pseudooceanicola sp.]
MIETPLDRAHAAMMDAPGDDSARLRFYERLADNELFVLLTAEARDDRLAPEVFELTDASYILAFDSEARLAGFAGREVPYAALSGRVIAQMLAGQGLGLGLNLDVAPSSILLPADAVAWLVETLGHAPEQVESRIKAFHRPAGLPDALLEGLDVKLALSGGMAEIAYLVGTETDSGRRGHMLAFIDARPGAESALAKAAGEALIFSGVDQGEMDVAFFAGSDTMAASLARSGLRIDLPKDEPQKPERAAPGSDPDKPPILR